MTMAERVQEFTANWKQAANQADVDRGMKTGGGGNWFSYSEGHVQLSFGGTNAPMRVTANGLAEAARPVESQEEFDGIAREMRTRHNIWLRPYGCGMHLQSGFSLNPSSDCVEPLRLVHGTSDYFPNRDCVLAVPITEQVTTFRCGDAYKAVNALRWDGEQNTRYARYLTVKGMSPFQGHFREHFHCTIIDGAIEIHDNGTTYRVALQN